MNTDVGVNFITTISEIQWSPKGHYSDAIMNAMASQIISLTIVYSTVYSVADQRKHQSCESLAFVRGIHKGPVARERFPFDDLIMTAAKNNVISQETNNSDKSAHRLDQCWPRSMPPYGVINELNRRRMYEPEVCNAERQLLRNNRLVNTFNSLRPSDAYMRQ